MTALLVTTDLMALAAADGAAAQTGVALCTVAAGVALAEADASTRLVAVDLTAAPADLATLVAGLRAAAPSATLLAYGPHVHVQRLQAAEEAGFEVVMSRGQFHRQLADLLRRYAAS